MSITSISNHQGYKFVLFPTEEGIQASLTDKWGIELKQAIPIVLSNVSKEDAHEQTFPNLLKRETDALASNKNPYGFEIYEQNGQKILVFDAYGLAGGTRDAAMFWGFGGAGGGIALGAMIGGPAGAIIGGCIAGGGFGMGLHGYNTPEEHYTDDDAIYEGIKGAVVGGAAGALGPALNVGGQVLGEGAKVGSALINGVCGGVASTSTEEIFAQACNEQRPERHPSFVKRLAGGAIGGGIGGGVGALGEKVMSGVRMEQVEDVFDAMIEQAVQKIPESMSSSVASTAAQNIIEGRPLTDNLQQSAAIGAFSGLVGGATKGAMDYDPTPSSGSSTGTQGDEPEGTHSSPSTNGGDEPPNPNQEKIKQLQGQIGTIQSLLKWISKALTNKIQGCINQGGYLHDKTIPLTPEGIIDRLKQGQKITLYGVKSLEGHKGDSSYKHGDTEIKMKWDRQGKISFELKKFDPTTGANLPDLQQQLNTLKNPPPPTQPEQPKAPPPVQPKPAAPKPGVQPNQQAPQAPGANAKPKAPAQAPKERAANAKPKAPARPSSPSLLDAKAEPQPAIPVSESLNKAVEALNEAEQAFRAAKQLVDEKEAALEELKKEITFEIVNLINDGFSITTKKHKYLKIDAKNLNFESLVDDIIDGKPCNFTKNIKGSYLTEKRIIQKPNAKLLQLELNAKKLALQKSIAFLEKVSVDLAEASYPNNLRACDTTITLGNCLFDNIAFQLLNSPTREEISATSHEVRQRTVEYMRNHLEEFIPFLQLEGDPQQLIIGDGLQAYQYTTWEQYLQALARDRVWADQLVLKAVAKAYDRKLTKYIPGELNPNNNNIYNDGGNNRNFFIAHIGGNHFISLIHKDELGTKVHNLQDIRR